MGNQNSTTASVGPKVTVHILTGRASKNSREMVGRTLLIGSDAECDVQMRSLDVADHHCLLTKKSNGLLAKRLAPDYPVLVNGRPITEQELFDNDTLKIGPFELRVSIEGVEQPMDFNSRDVADHETRFARERAERPTPRPIHPPLRPLEEKPAVRDPQPVAQAPLRPAPAASRPTRPPISRAAQLARNETAIPAPRVREPEPAPLPPPPPTPQQRIDRPFESTSEVFKRLSHLKQSEIERQHRELNELRAKLDLEHAELQQARRQLQQEKDSLERSYKEQARREQDLQARIQQLEIRQEAQKATEQGIEQQRVLLTEDMLELDRKRDQLQAHKQKLMRVRERLFQQYRDRRRMVAELVENLESRAAELQEQEKQLAITRSRVEGYEAQVRDRDHELSEREAALVEEAENLKLQLEDLHHAKDRLEEEKQSLHRREHSLQQLSDELQRRQNQLNSLESELVEKDRRAQEELDSALERSRDLQRRLEEIEERSQQLDAQQVELRDLQEKLEQQRVSQVQHQSDIESRQAKIESIEAELLVRQQEIARKEQQLREQALRQKELDQQLAKRREENDRETLDLQQRSTELEAQAQALYEELEEKRVALERLEKDLEQEKKQLQEFRSQLEGEQDSWIERINAVREEAAEIAQHAAILKLERSSLDNRARQLDSEAEVLKSQQNHLQQEKDKLQAARQQFEQETAQLRQKHHELDEEAARLQELSTQLSQRQQDLVRRESAWCEDVKRRRMELEHQAADIEQRRLTLDRQIRAHRRQVQKLREVSLKVAQRKKESSALLDNIQQQGTIHDSEVLALRENHQELLDSMQEYANQAADRERELAALKETLRSESTQLTAAQRNVRDQVRELILDCATQVGGDLESVQQRRREIARQLEKSLADWNTYMNRMAQSLGMPKTESLPSLRLEQSQAATAPVSPPEVPKPSIPETPKASLSEVPKEEPDPMPIGLALFSEDEVDTDPAFLDDASESLTLARTGAVASPQPPADVPLTDADRELLDAAIEHQLIDRAKALAAVAAPMALGQTFEQAAIQTNTLTSFQIQALQNGKADTLKLAGANVLDKLHADSIATTFKVAFPDASPKVIWLLEKRWCRDPQLGKTFEINVQPLTTFRHGNVAAIEKVISVGDQYGLIVEYVDGASLAALARHGMPGLALVQYCWQTVQGLLAAHRAGFIHHNLRPNRIMLDRQGIIKIVGYGEPVWISKIQRCENAKTIGRYVAPEENLAGQPGDVRADLYSLGKIFSELLTVVEGDSLPHGFQAMVQQLCHEEPSQRCRSTGEVLSILEEMLGEAAIGDPWPQLSEAFEQLASTKLATPLAKAA